MIVQLLLNGVLLGGVYSLMAIGLTLIFGVVRIVNFAHGEFVMLGMYATFLLHSLLGMDPYVSILVVTPLMFVIGWVLNRLLMKRVVGKPAVVQIFVTVGLSQIMMSGALMVFHGDFLQVPTSYSTTSIHIGPYLVGLPQVIAFLISMLVYALLFLLLHRTYTGKAIRATAQNRESATLMGVDIKKMYALTLAIGTALTGLCAALLTPMYPVNPTIGLNFVLMTFVVVVMGGLGSIPGALLGGLLIGIVETMSSYFFDPGWKQAVYFIVFILLLIVRPQGFFGKIGAEEL